MPNLHRTIHRFALLLLVVTSGCASWHTSEDKQLSRALPPPRKHPGGAVLEVAFVSIQPPKPAAVAQRGRTEQQVFPTGGAVGDQGGRSLRDRNEQQALLTGEAGGDQGGRSLRDRNEQQVLPTGGAVGDTLASGGAVGDTLASDGAASDLEAGDAPEIETFDLATLVALEESEPVDAIADEPAADVAAAPAASAAARAQEDIWQWIDETVVAPEVRQLLRRNGLRMGKVQRTADFNERLNRIRRNPGPTSKVLEIAEVESDLSHQARLITCRIGKRYELPVRQPSAGEQAVLVTLGGKTVGQTLSQPQPLFALRATAADVNSIRLSLRPEIQHGAARQTWVGSDAALRIDNRRASWTFEELAAEVPLERGGILVAGCTYPAFGLGQQMFTGTTADGDDDQVLMVIRVADLPELIDH